MAKKLVEFKLGDDETILVEVEEIEAEHEGEGDGEGFIPIASTYGGIHQAQKSFEDSVAALKPLADAVIGKLKSAAIPPDEIKIDLEVKLTGKGSLILAATEGSASFKVGMIWRKNK